MNRAQRRQADKLAKHKPNRSRAQLNNMVMLEFETFETIERMFQQIRNGELNYHPVIGWVILGGNGQLTDIVYSLGWWLKQWATVANRASIAYDDTALRKLHKALEYHMPLSKQCVANAHAVVQQQRHIYRTIDQQLLMRVVNELQAEQSQQLEIEALIKAKVAA